MFDEGQWVDIIGTSKGKGFQGVVKRFHFAGQPMSHGHMMHRRPGGVGAGTDPGRIWKNKEMPGRHGNYRKTIQNLKIVRKRAEDNVLLVSGSVPGARGGYIVIRPAIKKEGPVRDLKAKEAPAENSDSAES
jgi:large subunit ribosomal protein L3